MLRDVGISASWRARVGGVRIAGFVYCAFSCLGLCQAADRHRWEALYTFGDCYSDSGAGYIDTNGPTAVVYLAASLNIPFTFAGDPNSSGKSLNFAVSGASTGKSDGFRVRPAVEPSCGPEDALLGRGILSQVLDFAQRVNSGALRFDAEKTLFFFAGGLNDRLLPTPESVSNLEGAIRYIYKVGGKYFMVALLPTKIPNFADVGSRLNPALTLIPQELQSTLPGIHVRLSHWGEYFDRVIQRPVEFGISNTTDLCAGRALYGEDHVESNTRGRS